jgi:hypothetical protein
VSGLFDEIQRLVGEVNATMSIAFDRRGAEAVLVVSRRSYLIGA